VLRPQRPGNDVLRQQRATLQREKAKQLLGQAAAELAKRDVGFTSPDREPAEHPDADDARVRACRARPASRHGLR
jgi:hypothetical protein